MIGLEEFGRGEQRRKGKLFGLVRQSDLNDPGDVSGRRLHPDGMWRNQLEEEGKGRPRVSTQKHHLTLCVRTEQLRKGAREWWKVEMGGGCSLVGLISEANLI
ncbi:hypothetical protein EYF80_023373 [Liparis tanakae]|uniref:Uncharacterized protein n=1 Tax=Liparis tanakae TaxID=230148 RepID=A0A4Z2HMF7_9TELE|nr:hypothetical protein EYF80_023373 [Liparis tanakae]